MGTLLRLLLVAAHLAAAASLCPAPLAAAGERHTTLEAPCPCGCSDAPPAVRAPHVVAALAAVMALPALPRAASEAPMPRDVRFVYPHPPEPVPRPA